MPNKVTKPFDKDLFSENDTVARNFAKRIISLMPGVISVEDNCDKYGVDLLVKSTTGIEAVECEVKSVWRGYEFPFDTVQIPERKTKYANKNTLFFMTNRFKTRALIIKGQDLLDSPKKEVKNIYVKEGEYFFQVPLSKVVFVDLE